MVVLTFTGTAIADQQPLAAAAEIVRREPGPRAVVVPALAGVPERLDQVIRFVAEGRSPAARALVGRIAQRHRDLAAKAGGAATAELIDVIDAAFHQIDSEVQTCSRARAVPAAVADSIHAWGPLLSSRIFAAALRHTGIDASWLDAADLIVTQGDHGRAAPMLSESVDRIARAVAPLAETGRVPVIGGSVGANAAGVRMTMGAGSTNLTAAVVAAGAGAHEIHIWTDADGVPAAEPGMVSAAHTVPQLSFAEARELANAGARSIDAATIDVAATRGTPVRIRNARRPEQPGTVVNGKASANQLAPAALACRRPGAVLRIWSREPVRGPVFMKRILDICEQHQVEPLLSESSNSSVIAAFGDGRALDRIAAAAGEFADLKPVDDMALLSAVGESLTLDPRVTADVVSAVGDLTLHGVVQHPSGRAVTMLVDEADAGAAMRRVYERFFGGRAPADDSPTRGPEPQ